jgi:hypothetical protein
MIIASDRLRRYRSRLRCGLQAAGGLAAVIIGCYAVLYVFAFSSTIDPRLAGWDRWRLILEKMILTLNVIPVALGGFMTLAGLAVVLTSLHRIAFGAIGPKQPALFIVSVAMLMGAAFLSALVAIFV